MAKCWSIKIIKKKAERAMVYFLPIEEFKNPLISYLFWLQIYSTNELPTNFVEFMYSI